MLSNEILQMPKVDLHCHLDGSLTLSCVRELLGQKVKLEELQVSENCRDLAEYLEKFELPLQCIQTPDGLKKAGRDFLVSTQADHVCYIEVRFAPLLSENPDISCRTVIESVLDGLKEGKKQSGILYNVIVCAMRHHSEEDNIRMLKTAREFLGEGVCAADLAGNEAAFPMRMFGNIFEEARAMDFPFTIHAGECGSVDNVIESAQCGAKRIGHGIALKGHPDAIELCRRKNIGIEMCPLSNMQTKAVERISDYPIREFIDAGLKVTINTDNRTVSNSTIAKEMAFVQENFGISDSELKMLTKTAVEVSFADDAIRHQLLNKIK